MGRTCRRRGPAIAKQVTTNTKLHCCVLKGLRGGWGGQVDCPLSPESSGCEMASRSPRCSTNTMHGTQHTQKQRESDPRQDKALRALTTASIPVFRGAGQLTGGSVLCTHDTPIAPKATCYLLLRRVTLAEGHTLFRALFTITFFSCFFFFNASIKGQQSFPRLRRRAITNLSFSTDYFDKLRKQNLTIRLNRESRSNRRNKTADERV